MKNDLRYFKVYKLNNKSVEYGRVKISSKSGTPLDAAKKLLSSICLHEGIKNKLKCKVEFYIKETTNDSKKKIYGPYKGSFKKYEKPLIVKLKDGREIKHTVYPHVYKLKSKRTLQKGGVEILSNIESYIKNNNTDKILNYLQIHPDPEDLQTVLNMAIKYNNFNIVRTLIEEKNIDVNHVDLSSGMIAFVKVNSEKIPAITLLTLAILNDSHEIIEYLIENGADIDLIDDRCFRPLRCAVVKNNIELVNLLISKGADVNGTDLTGESPLISAIKHNNLDIVQLLIDNGADVNIRNNSDYAPAIVTAVKVSNINIDIIQLLIDNGADLKLKDDYGKNALMAAVDINNSDVYNRNIIKNNKNVLKLLLNYSSINNINSILKNENSKNKMINSTKELLENSIRQKI